MHDTSNEIVIVPQTDGQKDSRVIFGRGQGGFWVSADMYSTKGSLFGCHHRFTVRSAEVFVCSLAKVLGYQTSIESGTGDVFASIFGDEVWIFISSSRGIGSLSVSLDDAQKILVSMADELELTG